MGDMGSRTAGLGLALLTSMLLLAPIASAEGLAKGHDKQVCGSVTGKHARCFARVDADKGGTPLVTSTYQSGYGPGDLQSAYNLATAAASAGGTQTVGIVDAYDAPSVEADLGVYRSQFGLGDCTTANGCFRKVNQSGTASPLPSADSGWAQETSLDVDMVSAICPKCKILLVEANSNSYADLAAAVDRAATMGATQISNSYGGSELFGGSYESHYNHPGIDITVSSGDNGYGVEFPASSPHVTAVGGTHLVRGTNGRGWFETVWSGAGSGCSSVFAKPSWQSDSGCARRSVADVAAVADPATGVAVYDSYPSGGWYVFGGTSVASPIIAAVDGLAGGRSPGSSYGRFPYDNPSAFYDITGGSNGSCSQTYLCTGVGGYDGPTGMGTPNGVAVPAPPAAPVNTGPPAISPSTPTEGQTLTTTNGTWDNNPTSFTYAWQCNPTPCSSATDGGSYVVAHGDVGKTIQVTVTAHNGGGDTAATSDATSAVAAVPADFSISVSPTSRSIRRGQSTTFTVTVTPNSSFSGTAALSATGAPSGTTTSFSPTSTRTTSTMTVQTTSSTPQGTYTLTITGTGGSQTHSTTATLTVKRR
jgi:subtilase family serine protease